MILNTMVYEKLKNCLYYQDEKIDKLALLKEFTISFYEHSQSHIVKSKAQEITETIIFYCNLKHKLLKTFQKCVRVQTLYLSKFVSSTVFKMNDNILITTDADQYWLAIQNNKVQWGAKSTSIHINKKSQPLQSYPLKTCSKYIVQLKRGGT